MRQFLPKLASAATLRNGFQSRPTALLPPIHLYRRLLRAHRKHLPTEMRVLGNEYIKAEFRAHRKVDNPVHIIGFLSEWQTYAQAVEGDSWVGDKIDQSKLQKMSDEQIAQLYELMRAIQNRHKENQSE